MSFPERQLTNPLGRGYSPAPWPIQAEQGNPPHSSAPYRSLCVHELLTGLHLPWQPSALRNTRQRAAEEQKLYLSHEEPQQDQKPNGLKQSVQVLAIDWQRSSCGYCLTAISPGKQQGYRHPADRRLHSQHFITSLQALPSWNYLIWRGLCNPRVVLCPPTALTINIQSILLIQPEWEGALISA